MSDKRKFLNGLITGLLIAVVIVGGVYAGQEAVAVWKQKQNVDSAQTESVANARTMQKLQLIEEIIQKNFALDMADDAAMENGIYQGLVNSLQDPYAKFSREVRHRKAGLRRATSS